MIAQWIWLDPEDGKFTIALVVSVLIHGTFFIQFSYFRKPFLKSVMKETAFVYFPIQVEADRQSNKRNNKRFSASNQKMPPKPKILLEKSDVHTETFMKDFSKFSHDMKLSKKQSIKLKAIEEKRYIAVSDFKSERIKNPIYLTYSNAIRNRIRDMVKANYASNDIGEVYITFVVTANGELQAIKLIREKTTANEYLENLGLGSVRSSSPFPAFPKELGYPELTFNITIAFREKEL